MPIRKSVVCDYRQDSWRLTHQMLDLNMFPFRFLWLLLHQDYRHSCNGNAHFLGFGLGLEKVLDSEKFGQLIFNKTVGLRDNWSKT